MSDEKKQWSKPVLTKLTPTQALDLLMTGHAEASARDVGRNAEVLRLERDVAELSQNLAEARELLAECQSRIGASDAGGANVAHNANGDYRPPYPEEGPSRRTKRKG